MRNKIFILVFVLINLYFALPAYAERPNAETASSNDSITRLSESQLSPCILTRTDGIGVTSLPYFEALTGVFVYMYPAVCGGTVYPFEITEFSYTLVDSMLLYWPLYLDIIVYDMAVPGDSCSGPGEILCHYAMYADMASFLFPNIGTFILPDTCCVEGPFYIGIEFMSGQVGWTPSITFDGQIEQQCISWYKSFGEFYEWTTVIPDTLPGYPLYWVNGETNAPNCGGTEPCDCIPGDANGDGVYNILDITYIIAYLYKGGPPPVPYQVCSGDANCDCTVNILDTTYLIAFLYKGGPPPCDCPTWTILCGTPLYK